jgi:pyruvate ferredoxin oxidoreductase gamma subunit
VITVPASEIAGKLAGRPIPHAALAAGLAALTGMVSLDSILTAVRQRFPGPAGKAHAAAAMATFGIVRTEIEDLTRAAVPR